MKKITFSNLSQQLMKYRDDANKCERIVSEVLEQDPEELPVANELDDVLRNTAYFKRENVYELEDYFQLHELHPIHLLLSLKESPELYSRLYDLYRFQEARKESEWIPLIQKYKNDPKVTEKQIEIFAYDKPRGYTPDVAEVLANTLYMKNNREAIVHNLKVAPFSIILQREISRHLHDRSYFISDNCIINTLALEIELLKHEPIYRSKRLVKRTNNIFLHAETFEARDIMLPQHIYEGIDKITNILFNLKPGQVILPRQRTGFNTAIKFSLKNIPEDIVWRNIASYAKEHHQDDLSEVFLLCRKLDKTNIDSLIKSFRNSNNIIPSFQCSLEFPKIMNLWSEVKLTIFIKNFIEKLGLRHAGFIVYANKKQEGYKVEIVSQNFQIKGNKCIPLGLATAYQRGKEILAQMEHRYGIQQSIPAQINKYLNKEAVKDLHPENKNRGKKL